MDIVADKMHFVVSEAKASRTQEFDSPVVEALGISAPSTSSVKGSGKSPPMLEAPHA